MSIASVQWLIESRPPGMTWSRPSSSLHPNQPQLDLSDHEADRVQAPSNDRGVRVSTVRARWAARPRRGLPDAQQWSTTLALALIQALLAQRPVAQATLCKRDLAQSKTVRDRSNLFDMRCSQCSHGWTFDAVGYELTTSHDISRRDLGRAVSFWAGRVRDGNLGN